MGFNAYLLTEAGPRANGQAVLRSMRKLRAARAKLVECEKDYVNLNDRHEEVCGELEDCRARLESMIVQHSDEGRL